MAVVGAQKLTPTHHFPHKATPGPAGIELNALHEATHLPS